MVVLVDMTVVCLRSDVIMVSIKVVGEGVDSVECESVEFKKTLLQQELLKIDSSAPYSQNGKQGRG